MPFVGHLQLHQVHDGTLAPYVAKRLGEGRAHKTVNLGLGVSVFEVPREHVKGRRRPRLVVCNSVAQSVVEAQRGKHEEFVFVYRRERVKKIDEAPAVQYRPIETMNNTAWQRARREAGLPDLHVHDLRHTVGMRLRKGGVPESAVADSLWRSNPSMTRHYSMAQIVELHSRGTGEDQGRHRPLVQEPGDDAARARGSSAGDSGGEKSPKSPSAKKNGLEAEASKPLIH